MKKSEAKEKSHYRHLGFIVVSLYRCP